MDRQADMMKLIGNRKNASKIRFLKILSLRTFNLKLIVDLTL